MKKQVVLFLVIISGLCFSYLEPAYSQSTAGSSAIEPITSQQEKCFALEEICKSARRTPSSIKKTHTSLPANPGVVSVCSPVITVGMPIKETAYSVANDSSGNQVQQTTESTGQMATSETKNRQEVRPPLSASPESTAFKFKIKNLLEADLKSSYKPFIWSIFIVFVALAVFVALTAKKLSNKGAKGILLLVAPVVITAILIYSALKWIGPKEVSVTTIDKLQALLYENSTTNAVRDSQWQL